jgi:hypothetical protein
VGDVPIPSALDLEGSHANIRVLSQGTRRRRGAAECRGRSFDQPTDLARDCGRGSCWFGSRRCSHRHV